MFIFVICNLVFGICCMLFFVCCRFFLLQVICFWMGSGSAHPYTWLSLSVTTGVGELVIKKPDRSTRTLRFDHVMLT